MTKLVLNNLTVETDLPDGTTVLDFVRYHRNLTGTKIGCREGDCGACTVLVGELSGEGEMRYRAMTSCLMPLANAAGKHVVTIEGINRDDGSLTPAQAALVDESGTQCGFCTVGFVMSLTGHALSAAPRTPEAAVSAIDGNICRCTGYKSIERAAAKVCDAESLGRGDSAAAIARGDVPQYFADIPARLEDLKSKIKDQSPSLATSEAPNPRFLSGGTDLYVQRPEEMETAEAVHLFDDPSLRFVRETETDVEMGASTVVTDLLESDVFTRLFPDLYKHLKLVSSTPIRNMATLAGNLANASPIGDMTAWLMALDAELEFRNSDLGLRTLPLREFYLGYKKMDLRPGEILSAIRFSKDFTHFNFEKVCKRQYLDIASVNTAISLKMNGRTIEHAHVSAGGVFATPLYLKATSESLRGREVSEETIARAASVMQTEIAPISDVRGTKEYKRLLLKRLFEAHFETVAW